MSIFIILILLTLAIMLALIGCYKKFGDNVYESQFALQDDEETQKILHNLKIGRQQMNRLALRIIVLYAVACIPLFIIKNRYGGPFTSLLFVCCALYSYRESKKIQLPPCPCCGTEDCLISYRSRAIFLTKYCRQCHTVLIK